MGLIEKDIPAPSMLLPYPLSPFTGPAPGTSARYPDGPSMLHLQEPIPYARDLPEAFVQDLWTTQSFTSSGLTTHDGQPVQVLSPGTLNTDAGPDFVQARLRLGDVLWAGDVEIHVTSKSWYLHQHDRDPRYNSVVLHVTLYSDLWTGRLRRQDGSLLPEVELFRYLRRPLRSLIHHYRTRSDDSLPCAVGWERIPEAVRAPWVEQLGRERLIGRARRLVPPGAGVAAVENNLHEHLFAALGYAPNAEPMRVLAGRLPLPLTRLIEDMLDLEALHLGVAGLLPEAGALLHTDRASADHVMDLRERYARLRHRLDLHEMNPSAWRFARLRPANFPPLRIAQAVALLRHFLHRTPLSLLREAWSSEAPLAFLQERCCRPPSSFWETHVRLEKTTRRRNPALGPQRFAILTANVLLPAMLGLAGTDPANVSRAQKLAATLPPGDDKVLRLFSGLGTPARNGFHAQGLQHLYRTRCLEGHCLQCPIGRRLLEESAR